MRRSRCIPMRRTRWSTARPTSRSLPEAGLLRALFLVLAPLLLLLFLLGDDRGAARRQVRLVLDHALHLAAFARLHAGAELVHVGPADRERILAVSFGVDGGGQRKQDGGQNGFFHGFSLLLVTAG